MYILHPGNPMLNKIYNGALDECVVEQFSFLVGKQVLLTYFKKYSEPEQIMGTVFAVDGQGSVAYILLSDDTTDMHVLVKDMIITVFDTPSLPSAPKQDPVFQEGTFEHSVLEAVDSLRAAIYRLAKGDEHSRTRMYADDALACIRKERKSYN